MNNSGKSGGFLGGLIGIIITIAGLVIVWKLVPGLFKIVLWGIIILVLLLIGLIVLIIVLAVKATRPKNDEATRTGSSSSAEAPDLDDAQKAALADARKSLMELRRVNMQTHVFNIREKTNAVCGKLDKILQTLREKPEKITSARQCLNYYIPTITDVMKNFNNLDVKGQMTETIREKTERFLKDVGSALDEQYSALFKEDVMGMEVDMEAMTIALRRDGLLDEKMEQQSE